jgi:hypothetical protein
MTGRVKKATQLGLGETAPKPSETPSAPALAPAWVSYHNGTERWVCKRFDALVAELPGLTVDTLPVLQRALEVQGRQWVLVRRLYGVMPEVPAPSYPIDDIRVWSTEELARFLNITKADQWQQELNAVRGIWTAVRPAAAQAPNDWKPSRPGLFSDDDLVKQYDFGRMRFRDQDEAARFAARLRDVEKLFAEKATAGLARNLLITEMHINRLDEAISAQEIVGEDFRKNQKQRGDLLADYNAQLALIDKLAPWFGAVAGKFSFKGALAEVTAAMQQYYAEGTHDLIDGIFTSTEVQVECRRSVQTPEPRYRLGWVTYAIEAKANLWNPNWQSAIPQPVLKRLDKSMKAAIIATGQEMGEAVPDLQKGEEYAPLLTTNPQPGPVNPL